MMRHRKKTEGRRISDKLKLGGILAAFLAALAVFLILLQIEKNELSQFERGKVYVAAKMIPKGEVLTDENFGEYVREESLDQRMIPEAAIRDPGVADGMSAVFDIEPGVMLSVGMFETTREILEQLREPVIAGFKADDLYQVVGGVLRSGDRINIYRVSKEAKTVEWENVYVQSVFDQSGGIVENTDHTKAAQRINIYLEKSEVENFYRELDNGSLRVVKICR